MRTPLKENQPPLIHALGLPALLLSCILMTNTGRATDLYWDANGDGSDSNYGGDGVWDSSTPNWNTSADIGSGSLQAWPGTSDYEARFLLGTSGNITVDGTVNVMGTNWGLTFGQSAGSFTTGSSNYTLSGGTLDVQVANNFGFIINQGGSSSSTTINSTLNLFGNATGGFTQRMLIGGGSITVGDIVNTASVTNTQLFRIEGNAANSVIHFSGDITKTGTGAIKLQLGRNSDSNSAEYILSGNNTGLGSSFEIYRGIVTLNNSGAIGGAGTINLNNASTGTGTSADTIQLLIGTAGVNINKNISILNISSGDTSDVRVLGGSHTSGTSTFSGTINLGTFASSGTGASLQITAASGGTVNFSNTISDGSNSVPIIKVGGGTVKFSRSSGNTYDGGTTVSEGTLLVTNTSNSGTGTGAVMVASGAVLGGTGFIAPSIDNSVTVSGTVAVGDGASASAFSISTSGLGSLSFGAGSDVELELFTNTLLGADRLVTVGVVNFDSDVTLNLLNTGALTLAEGDSFDLFDWGSAPIGSFATLNLPTLDGGLTWDTSDLYSGGLISVTAVPEPAYFALLTAVSMGGVVFWRRRRR